MAWSPLFQGFAGGINADDEKLKRNEERDGNPRSKPPLYLSYGAPQRSGKVAALPTNPTPVPPAPAFRWEDRLAVLNDIDTQKGNVTTMKITLMGRPGKIIDRGACIITSMQDTKAPSLPKGLPTPPTITTSYSVYVASKQWKKVAEALKDESDMLIIEGYPQIDTQTGTITVFATNTTTKYLQAALRQKLQADPSGSGQ